MQSRKALIGKTRVATFPDQERFDWSYSIMVKRYEAFAGVGAVTGNAEPILLCTNEQVAELREPGRRQHGRRLAGSRSIPGRCG